MNRGMHVRDICGNRRRRNTETRSAIDSGGLAGNETPDASADDGRAFFAGDPLNRKILRSLRGPRQVFPAFATHDLLPRRCVTSSANRFFGRNIYDSLLRLLRKKTHSYSNSFISTFLSGLRSGLEAERCFSRQRFSK